MDQIRITHLMPTRLAALGIAPTDMLRRARLPQTLFQQERVVVSTAQWFALWRVIDQINDDPAFGLKLPQAVLGGSFDPLTITALSARSFYEGLTKIARYKRLFCSEEIRIVEQDNAWNIEVVWLAAQEPAPPLLIDSMFSSFVELGRRGTGQALYPERIAFRREPLHPAMYEAYFQCPIDFGADRDVMRYRREALEQPFFTYNPDLLALLEPQLEATLHASVAPQRFIDQVKSLLRSRLAGQQPTVHAIASELHMSARTLQRRLADEGMHFQQVVEAVRRELARQYLTGSSLELNEIAFLLGYEEASSFHRAFRHWEGTSPGQWRAAHH